MQFCKHVKIKWKFQNIEKKKKKKKKVKKKKKKKKKKNVGLFISFAANVAQSCRNE